MHTKDFAPDTLSIPSATDGRTRAGVPCADSSPELPPLARQATCALSGNELLDGAAGLLTVTVGLVERIFQIASAIVLYVLGCSQFRAVFLTVRQQRRPGRLCHIRQQHIQVARGRVVFHDTPGARCQARGDQHEQQSQVHCG